MDARELMGISGTGWEISCHSLVATGKIYIRSTKHKCEAIKRERERPCLPDYIAPMSLQEYGKKYTTTGRCNSSVVGTYAFGWPGF